MPVRQNHGAMLSTVVSQTLMVTGNRLDPEIAN